ncbi:hypothetical protein [Duganella sp. CY15W]|uniref:hypothetical protein n=1 Tax=Duganella sp. CY15W TaxID=2692172 RepID=UPI001E3236EE|nr:hypothetical protein [Duganella sp. CY15W]
MLVIDQQGACGSRSNTGRWWRNGDVVDRYAVCATDSVPTIFGTAVSVCKKSQLFSNWEQNIDCLYSGAISGAHSNRCTSGRACYDLNCKNLIWGEISTGRFIAIFSGIYSFRKNIIVANIDMDALLHIRPARYA